MFVFWPQCVNFIIWKNNNFWWVYSCNSEHFQVSLQFFNFYTAYMVQISILRCCFPSSKISVGEIIEGQIIWMQSNSGFKWSTCIFCNFFPNKANSLSFQLIILWDYLSPCHYSMFETNCLFLDLLHQKWFVDKQCLPSLWNSLGICSWSFLICIFWGGIFCRPILCP